VILLRISERITLTADDGRTTNPQSSIQKRKRRYYPGTGENPFHYALVTFEYLERIPMLAMPFLLALIAASTFFVSRLTFYVSLVTFLFSLGDLVLLNLLPRAGRSYGPPQPPVILMGVLRTIVALILGALTRMGLPLEWALWLNLAIQAMGAWLALEAYWFGPYRLNVSHVKLYSDKLNPASEPLRVLHLADLHIERLTEREHTLVHRINELRPDAILFSGDLLNLSYVNDPRAQADCRTLFSQLHAPLGIYAVTGSIPVDTPEAVQAVLNGTHIRRLDDERVTLSKDGQNVDVIGITCTHHPEWDALRLQSLVNGQHPRFSLLLYHTPDLAPESSQLGIDLQLSGHTHGGQVRLPIFGALVTSSLYGKRFEMGPYQVGAMTLYVCRGIGMEGRGAPRVRFLCPPEVVLWEIGGSR
jgi:predicted MPP superfamily phosphohydrolase